MRHSKAGNETIREKAVKRWSDPMFRKRLSKLMSEGAKRRWANKKKREALLEVRSSPEVRQRNTEATRLSVLRLSAEEYGLTLEEWMGMTKKQRVKYATIHPKVKINRRAENTEMWAKRLKMTYEKFAKLAHREKLKLKITWNLENKKK